MNRKNFAAGLAALGISAAIPMLTAHYADVIPRVQPTATVMTSQQIAERACRLVLVERDSKDAIDREIERSQQAIRDGRQVADYLERLGWSYVARARTDFDSGFHRLALQSAQCLRGRDPGNLQANLLEGHVYHQLHRFADAETQARLLVDRRGLWFDYGLLGDALMEQGKLDEAAGAYQQMMDQRPGPQAYSRAAQLRWLKGDREGAVEMMRLAVRSQGHRNPELLAWVMVRLAEWEWALGRESIALSSAARVLEVQSNYPPALLLRGRILLSKNQPAAALADLANAAQQNPLPAYQWAYWEALDRNGNREQADDLRRTIASRGIHLDPRTSALFLLSASGPAQTAYQLADDELQVRRDIHTLDTMAWALWNLGEPTRAWTWMQAALAEGTREARLFFHAAVIAAGTGKTGRSNEFLHQLQPLRHQLYPSEEHVLQRFLADFDSSIIDPTEAPGQADRI